MIDGYFSNYCKNEKLSFRKIKKFYNLDKCFNYKSDYYKVYIKN